jgi:hypothetical protein
MHFKSMAIAAAVLATVATPIAVAAAESNQPQSRQKERRICRREPTTGTRLAAPRVCMTKSQWDAEETRARDDMTTMQNRQRVAVPGMGGVSRCPPGVAC